MQLTNFVVCLLQIQIGNAQYNCSCNLRYTSFHSDKVALIIGLCVGLGVLLVVIIIIITIIIACRRRCNKQREGTTDRNAAFAAGYNDPYHELEEDDRNSCHSPTATNEIQNMNEQACAPVDEPDENKKYINVGEPDPAYNSTPYYSSLHKGHAC